MSSAMYIDHALLSHLQPRHVQPLPIACMLARDVYAVLLQSTGVDSRRASDEGGCLQLGGDSRCSASYHWGSLARIDVVSGPCLLAACLLRHPCSEGQNPILLLKA